MTVAIPLWMFGLAAEQLLDDMNRLLALLFHQGVLDEHFLHLQQLEHETAPNFVLEVVNIYFKETEKLMRILRGLLMLEEEEVEFDRVGIYVNQMIGSSSSIGAKRIRNVCIAFRTATEQHNRPMCLKALAVLEQEYCYLKNKLKEFFQIEQHRVLASGARYPLPN